MHGPALVDRLAKIIGGYSSALSCRLHKGLMWAAICSHDHGKAGHAFAPDQSHFDVALVVAIGDDGHDAAVRKIDVLDRPAAHFQLPAQRKIDRRQMRLQQREVFGRQARQNPIGTFEKSLG